MTICYITNSSVPYGANKALLAIIDGAISQMKGVKICVVVTELGYLTNELEHRGIPYLMVGHRFFIYPKVNSFLDIVLAPLKVINIIYQNYSCSKAVIYYLNQNYNRKNLIIHSNTGPSLLGFTIARKLDTKHVWHLREYQDLDFGMYFFPSKNRFIKLLSRDKNVQISITRGIKEYFGNLESTEVIYDGVIDGEVVPSILNKSKAILFVGRIERAKGLDDLIRSFATWLKENSDISKDYKLLIAGDGKPQYVQSLKALSRELNCLDRMEWLGFVDDPIKLMQRMMCVVVPSRFEGFGLVTVEALYSGTIVIGRNTGGTKEILETINQDQFLFETPREIGNMLTEIASMNDMDYMKIVRKNQALVRSKFSLRVMSHKMKKFYYALT